MGGISTPVEPAIGSTMTAAMVEASCSATTRSRSSARSAPCSGWPTLKALRARSWVWRMWSTPVSRRAEHLAVAGNAADRDAAEVDAVVAALAADQPGALAFAARAVVGDGHLQRGFHRLGTRVGEEHLVHAGGRQLGHLVGQFEGLRVRHLEGRGEVHLGRLRPGWPSPPSAGCGRRSRTTARPRRRGSGGPCRPSSTCRTALTSRRGAFLNWRLAVKGIQKASRSGFMRRTPVASGDARC